MSGVQRYTLELLKRWSAKQYATLAPKGSVSGVSGHLWEQFVLPRKLQGGMLFSPSNTGPLEVKNQVLTIHDVVPLDHPEWLNPSFAAWYCYLIPRLARRVEHVIAVSAYSKKRIVYHTGIPSEKVTVISNGIDSSFFPRNDEEVDSVRRVLGISSRSYILSLGSLEPRKNLHGLLQAWEATLDRIPDDVWLVIVGGKGRKQVFQDVKMSTLPPRVYTTGHVADEHLPALYSGALAFAYLSFYEGFGLPPLEAMAAGTPVLTSNRTALPEVVGDAGLMVDPLRKDDIAEALLRLLENSDMRADFAAKGIKRAKLFNWDKTAELTWQVLHTMTL